MSWIRNSVYNKIRSYLSYSVSETYLHALTFQNYIQSHAMTYYFQINKITSSTLAALLLSHNMRQVRLTRSVSQALIPVPPYKNNYGRKSFLYTCTKIWNDIPYHIWTLPSTTYFKKMYKLDLLNTYTCPHWLFMYCLSIVCTMHCFESVLFVFMCLYMSSPCLYPVNVFLPWCDMTVVMFHVLQNRNLLEPNF